ncbi:MAG: hypothetical protein M1337_00940 [Actinobacteria bacterium]|nr:hypothetical protein [Actinomycetota bacterium]
MRPIWILGVALIMVLGLTGCTDGKPVATTLSSTTMLTAPASSTSAPSSTITAVSTSSTTEAVSSRWTEPFSTLVLDPPQIVEAFVAVHHAPLNLPATEFPEDVTDPEVAARMSALLATLRPFDGGAVEGLPPVTLSIYLADGRKYHVLSFADEYPMQIKSFVGGKMVDLDVVQSAEVSVYLDGYLKYRKSK